VKLRAVLVSFVLVAALLQAGCRGADDGSSEAQATDAEKRSIDKSLKPIAGRWGGEVSAREGSPLRIAVAISPTEGVRVAYASPGCAGTWFLQGVLASNPGQYFFSEQLEQGDDESFIGELLEQGDDESCDRDGSVEFNPYTATCPEQARSRRIECVDYRFGRNEVETAGLLRRISPAELDRVFSAAGVEPPES
jgi:hypothetical protein